jgi:hypothetical protein
MSFKNRGHRQTRDVIQFLCRNGNKLSDAELAATLFCMNQMAICSPWQKQQPRSRRTRLAQSGPEPSKRIERLIHNCCSGNRNATASCINRRDKDDFVVIDDGQDRSLQDSNGTANLQRDFILHQLTSAKLHGMMRHRAEDSVVSSPRVVKRFRRS